MTGKQYLMVAKTYRPIRQGMVMNLGVNGSFKIILGFEGCGFKQSWTQDYALDLFAKAKAVYEEAHA